MDLFFTLWFFVLPVIGILACIFVPVFWFFIVPGVCRMLTWAKYQNVSIHAVGDATGQVALEKTKVALPEGVVRTRRRGGWRFLPKISSNPEKDDAQEEFERISLKKYMLKDVGKPFFLDHAGQATSVNFGTVAYLQHKNLTRVNIDKYMEKLEEAIKEIPKKKYRDQAMDELKLLQKVIHVESLTNLDLDRIPEFLEEEYSPSVIDAFAINREEVGARRARRDMWPWILGGAIIIGVTVIGVVAILSI